MSFHHDALTLPVLEVIKEDIYDDLSFEKHKIHHPPDPQPTSICVFDHHGRPIDGAFLDLSTVKGGERLAEMITDARGEELSVMIWSEETVTPLDPYRALLTKLQSFLQRYRTRYELSHLPDTIFTRSLYHETSSFLEQIRSLLSDQEDIAEILTFEEPHDEMLPNDPAEEC